MTGCFDDSDSGFSFSLSHNASKKNKKNKIIWQKFKKKYSKNTSGVWLTFSKSKAHQFPTLRTSGGLFHNIKIYTNYI